MVGKWRGGLSGTDSRVSAFLSFIGVGVRLVLFVVWDECLLSGVLVLVKD